MITKTVAVAAVVLAAVAASVVTPAAATGPVWTDCADPAHPGYQCTTLDVPLSYQDPSGPTVRLALGRLPAVDQAHKLGTIVYNPGGPGVSGRFAPPLTPGLHQRYDLVGFDPRGVGASTPVRCFTDPKQLDVVSKAVGTFPVTYEQSQEQLAAVRYFTGLCAKNGGPLLSHLSTAVVARDLDRIRAALGEDKLRYYGLSYGTVLGQTYANMFPDHVAAMVLDAADDTVNWFTGYRPQDADVPFSVRLGAFNGAQDALQTFLRACAASPKCAFRGGDLNVKYDALLDRLAKGPVRITDPATGKPTVVDYPALVTQVDQALTFQRDAPKLADLLQAVRTAPDAPAATSSPEPTPALALAPTGATPIKTPVDSLVAGGATFCADTVNPATPELWWSYASQANQQVRGFGPEDAYKSLPCPLWPDRTQDTYRGPWDRETAVPVLVLGNQLGDPETPFDGAQRVVRNLGNARLLALDAYGHGSLGQSACVGQAVDRYFGAGTLPAPGTVCVPDHRPFE
ncbi:alpha/beta hydrolase [Labedaea rhizosphaerae]|uniref:TAP-like protein n=1 Tax=Labedaea rhizosphaerae TaxID=598644 RepID=A0A4R6SA36_LABRH|nr:alpha/beta hydrolase [Labedaea rhizosphaerae]TDP96343.1 TAP-like protein [Labedaea rhizosphaerae]